MDIKCSKRTEQKIAFIKRNLHQDYIIDAGVIELILQHSNWINIRNALVPITFLFFIFPSCEIPILCALQHTLTHSLSFNTFYIFIVAYRLLHFFNFVVAVLVVVVFIRVLLFYQSFEVNRNNVANDQIIQVFTSNHLKYHIYPSTRHPMQMSKWMCTKLNCVLA